MKQHVSSYVKCQLKKTATITASGERDAPIRLCSQEDRILGAGGKESEEPDFTTQSLWHLAGSRESGCFDYELICFVLTLRQL